MKNKPILLRTTTVSGSLYKLLEGQLKYMNRYFKVHTASSPGEKLNLLKKRELVQIHEIEMYRGISPIKDLVSIYKMIKLIKLVKPNIIHSHTPKAGLISMIAGYYCGISIRLHTVAGIPAESTKGFKKWLLLKMEQLTYFFATKVYPNSYSLKKIIVENNLCPNKKIKIIGKGSSNGINLEYFKLNQEQINSGIEIRNKLHILKDEKIFIFIGRLVKDKGIVELIEAFEKVNKSNINSKLLILGSFDEQGGGLPKETINTININSNIIHVGFIKDIRPYLSLSDVFVFPTYREGLPNVLLQASAYALSIVATNATGNTDIITNNQNGLLVPIKDVNQLVNAMEKLLKNSELRIKLGNSAIDIVKSNYSQKYLWEEILKEYNIALNIN